jgi:hypothetical protein
MTTDTGQLTFTTMGGEAVTVKKRGKHYVEPRGYADRPGTGPEGETCGSCRHRTGAHNSRRDFPKCALTSRCHTSGRRTDILVRSPACRKWEAK